MNLINKLMVTQKQTLLENSSKYLLIFYVVLSALFIAYSSINYLKFSVYNAWFQDWVNNTIGGIITESTNECKPFNLYMWDNKVDLINMECLQQTPIEE